MAQAAFEFAPPPVAALRQPQTGFEIGWDHAHYGLVPPAEHLHPAHPLRQGWDAGRTSFGQRTLKPNRHVRKWLQLRLHAWLRGRSFEGIQVTPHFLAQIDTPRCPVTRGLLTHATGQGSDASVDRVNNQAGYAAGNLAVISTRANQAKDRLGWEDARRQSMQAEQSPTGQVEGLSAAEWARLSVLMSFCTPLPHATAATLPLLVLPPNRLRVLNAIQGLQALVTLQLAQPGWSARIVRLARVIPGDSARRDFNLFFHSLLPRVLEGGPTPDPVALRDRLEDAWRQPAVLRRWQRFATQLTAAQAQALLQRAVKLGMGQGATALHDPHQATEGWALEHGGYEAPPAANDTAVPRALRLASPVAARPAPVPVQQPLLA